MTADGHQRRARRRTSAAGAHAFEDSDEIQDAYLKRAIAEMSALNDEIHEVETCDEHGVLPVMSSGSPRAEIAMIKWAPSVAEQQEGVAFFGRAGTAILKSVQRLGIDPLALYGTLCVKCLTEQAESVADLRPPWLARELQIVDPKLIVPMGERVIEALNGLEVPLSRPLRAVPGEIQQWTPAVEAVFTPDIDESLDEQSAKRAFWAAFRVIGDWHEAQPPY
jgi:uracil-DNA glycosylase family 4